MAEEMKSEEYSREAFEKAQAAADYGVEAANYPGNTQYAVESGRAIKENADEEKARLLALAQEEADTIDKPELEK